MESRIRSERDEGLKRLRPTLEGVNDSKNEDEIYQNEVLRPILKFQNAILLAQFRQYLYKFKPAFNAYNQKSQRSYIEDVLKQDPKIKNSLIATVVSVMTLEEYETYCDRKNELNKRIIGMVTKRVQDHLEMLY